ncbi:DUF2589 domain-containing protein [Kangiella aquimarina]|uniref:DUF2589 domain-containing protein n=1 Tax=Kangiella aquimarina TaxID=261965 RepID=A0ABZ0X7B1_9GAMM|nr:DUF2589 domain-containing protein [Kangiella aquimarina]WQG86496.1 DUF2589 domain-containing protein [Kangiella aquimarina]
MSDAQPPLVSMAEQFTGLPMGDLIGAPLLAAAKANSAMAATQTKFLLDTCFAKETTDDGKDHYQPVLIKMTLSRGVLVPVDPSQPDQEPTISEVKTTFDLPLLTILPLNSLAVDDVSIGFDMEVKSSFSETTNEKTEEALSAQSSFSAKVGYGVFSAEVSGSVSYDSASSSSRDTHYEKSNSAQYSVKVHAGQIPLPQGVTTIIQAFTNSISPIEMPVYGEAG